MGDLKPLETIDQLLKMLLFLDQNLKQRLSSNSKNESFSAIITQTILQAFDRFAPVENSSKKPKKF